MSSNNPCELNVRIIELPSVPMARSGSADLDAFFNWAITIMYEESSLFPRYLFMWFNSRLNSFEWLLAIPAELPDTNGYAVFPFPGGLYAVAACKDEGPDIERTNRLIHEWVVNSAFFDEDSGQERTGERYDMGQMITPRNAKELMGFDQMDLYVPIIRAL